MQAHLDNFITPSSRNNSSYSLGETRSSPLKARNDGFADALDKASKQQSTSSRDLSTNSSSEANTDESFHIQTKKVDEGEVQDNGSQSELNTEENHDVNMNKDSERADADSHDGGNELPKKNSTYVKEPVNDENGRFRSSDVKEPYDLNFIESLQTAPISMVQAVPTSIINEGLTDQMSVIVVENEGSQASLDLNEDALSSSNLAAETDAAGFDLLLDGMVDNSNASADNTVVDHVDSLAVSQEISGDILPISAHDTSEVLSESSKMESLDERLKQVSQIIDVDSDLTAGGLLNEDKSDILVSTSTPLESVVFDTNDAEEVHPINLNWVLGEMKKQASEPMNLAQVQSATKESVLQGDKLINPLLMQKTSLEKTTEINVSVDYEQLTDPDVPLLMPNVKSETKSTFQLSPDFKLPPEFKLISADGPLSADDAFILESVDSDILKNSSLFDDQVESLTTLTDSKLFTSPSTAMNSSVLSVTTQSNQSTSQPSLTMTVPPNDPNWPQEMQDKVKWIMREGVQTAEIHLDPPELGSLSVKVSLDSDGASVTFSAATPQARDLLESQMQRLRELLAQQGVDLNKVDVNVSQGQHQDSEHHNSQGKGNVIASDDDDVEEVKTSYVNASGVDYYA